MSGTSTTEPPSAAPRAEYPRLRHRALYAAFDLFPSAKGAATHIAEMAGSLFDLYAGGVLYVIGNDRTARARERHYRQCTVYPVAPAR